MKRQLFGPHAIAVVKRAEQSMTGSTRIVLCCMVVFVVTSQVHQDTVLYVEMVYCVPRNQVYRWRV